MVDKRTVRRWATAYRRGRTYRQIAAAAGVDESTVRRALAPVEVQRRRVGPRGRKDITAEQVAIVWERIGSIRGAARELGVSATLVQARLHDLGLIERHPDQRPRQRDA